MKRTLYFWTIAALLVLAATAAGAQSLGDVARQNRKDKGKPAPATVYTNDNLPSDAASRFTGPAETKDSEQKHTESDGSDNSAKNEHKDASKDAVDKKADSDEKKADAEEKKSDDDLSAVEKEKKQSEEWRKKFADQKNAISMAERELDVLQREYRLRAAAYYADAGNSLRNQKPWADADRDYRAKIDAKQKELESAKQKLEDMKEEARKAGVPGSVAD